MTDAGRAFEIMRRRKCWVVPTRQCTWLVRTENDDDVFHEHADPVAAILAFDEAERRAGR